MAQINRNVWAIRTSGRSDKERKEEIMVGYQEDRDERRELSIVSLSDKPGSPRCDC
jgi:hypothetical protein